MNKKVFISLNQQLNKLDKNITKIEKQLGMFEPKYIPSTNKKQNKYYKKINSKQKNTLKNKIIPKVMLQKENINIKILPVLTKYNNFLQKSSQYSRPYVRSILVFKKSHKNKKINKKQINKKTNKKKER